MTGILRSPCAEHATNGILRLKIHHPLENSTHKLDISTFYTHLISFITVSYSLILIEISNIVRNDKKLSIRRVWPSTHPYSRREQRTFPDQKAKKRKYDKRSADKAVSPRVGQAKNRTIKDSKHRKKQSEILKLLFEKQKYRNTDAKGKNQFEN